MIEDAPTGAVQLGTVPYVNAWPLIEGLTEQPGVTLRSEPPSRLAESLLARELDAALVPVVTLLRDDALVPISGRCIAALGQVTSVLLLLRTAPSAVRTLALDPHSRTSQVLSRVILRDRYGVEPIVHEENPRLAWERGEADARRGFSS